MPHLNGSLTNIFTVINVFPDIIPLRVFSDAFYAFSLLSSLVQRTRIPIPRVITLKYVMMAIISIRNNIDPRWKNRMSSFDIFQKVSWLDYCCTIIFDKREKEFTTRRKIQSRIFRRNPDNSLSRLIKLFVNILNNTRYTWRNLLFEE